MASQVITTLPAPPQTVVGLRINNLQPTSATLSWEPLVGTGQTGTCILLLRSPFVHVSTGRLGWRRVSSASITTC